MTPSLVPDTAELFTDADAQDVLFALGPPIEWTFNHVYRSSIGKIIDPATGERRGKYAVEQRTYNGGWFALRAPVSQKGNYCRFVYETQEKARDACLHHLLHKEWKP